MGPALVAKNPATRKKEEKSGRDGIFLTQLLLNQGCVFQIHFMSVCLSVRLEFSQFHSQSRWLSKKGKAQEGIKKCLLFSSFCPPKSSPTFLFLFTFFLTASISLVSVHFAVVVSGAWLYWKRKRERQRSIAMYTKKSSAASVAVFCCKYYTQG